MQLQLVSADLVGVQTGWRVTLAWPDHDRNAISVNISIPASLTVTAVDFPSSVTVDIPVVPRVTITNGGTQDSGAFLIRWSLDAGRGRLVTLDEHPDREQRRGRDRVDGPADLVHPPQQAVPRPAADQDRQPPTSASPGPRTSSGWASGPGTS
jgi:hypothetical protein